MAIDYNHSISTHTLAGPAAALPMLFAEVEPTSLLDVGCGNGTWLKAAINFGIPDVFGVDGVEIPPNKLHVPAEKIQRQDLTQPWNLNRRFDVVICLEVAEHLDESVAPTLIDALVKHGDLIYFSAACPGQGGQHHVNCQWPDYWQRLFNNVGYACNDWPRWKIWGDSRIEPWYRQNLIVATKNKALAGTEPRIMPVINPAMHEALVRKMSKEAGALARSSIADGCMPLAWYLKTLINVAYRKSFHGSSK